MSLLTVLACGIISFSPETYKARHGLETSYEKETDQQQQSFHVLLERSGLVCHCSGGKPAQLAAA